MFTRSKDTKIGGKDGVYQHGLKADVIHLKQGMQEQEKASARVFSSGQKTEPLLFRDPAFPVPLDVHVVIEDRLSALPKYMRQNYTLAIAPFAISEGRCAILQDGSGIRICILEK